MMEFLQSTLFIGVIMCVIAFLSGSVPYGVLYSRMRGVDITSVGSGNIGATNVMRQFGFWQGFMPVFLMDLLKGLLPVLLFKLLTIANNNTNAYDIFEILVGLSAILGHVFSPFMNFKGGKGVATTGGVLFGWNYIVALICLASFMTLFFLVCKKIIGRTSLIMSGLFPIIVLFVPNTSLIFQITSIFIGALIFVAHRKNLKEWFTGEDLRKKQQKDAEKSK